MFENAGRQIGVRVPEGQSREDAPVQKVTNAVPCSMVAASYGDEFGKEHNVVLLKVGGAYYFPPNAESWSDALKPAAKWLARELDAKLSEEQTEVPLDDAVDVMATEDAAK